MVYGSGMNYSYPYQQMYQQPVYQQPQQQVQSGIYGRIVNNFDELTVNDIPMNGNAAYFPKSDMSEIECRQWKNDGTISRVVYKPCYDTPANAAQVVDNNLENAFNAFTDLFNERLDKLEKLIKPSRRKEGVEE